MPPKKILLAEDDADDKDFFFAFLAHRKDIHLLPATENGEEILEYLLAQAAAEALPDMIILDQNMPKLNGLQTLLQLKDQPAFSQIPVVIYSTYADATLVSNSMEAGALLATSKPTTPEGYNELIDDLLLRIS